LVDLFSLLPVKGLTLKNRIVMPPMGTSKSGDTGAVTDAHIEHYVPRAAAGVGTIIVEHAYVRQDGRVAEVQLGIHEDVLIPGLRRLAEEIKTHDTVAGIQITHGGGQATRATAGTQPVAPSDATMPYATEPARALTSAEIEAIVDAFAAATRRAWAAGFDFVEIHGAHGYLLSEFLSPLTNTRTDEYGGSLANRLRVPLQVVEAVCQVTDDEHLVLYRLGANDYEPGGLTQEEGRQAAAALVAAGVDLLDISAGVGNPPPGWNDLPQGYFVPMAAAIRTEVGVPVVVAGGITDPHFADQVIRSGEVDLVAIGRAMLAHPNWAVEARAKLAGRKR